MKKRSIIRKLGGTFLAATLVVGVTQTPVLDASESGLTIRNYDSHVDVRGLYFVLSADVVDSAGLPAAGVPVVFEELNLTGGPNRLLCVASTDATGRASCQDRPTLAPVLEHTWTLVYVMGQYDVWDTARGWVGVAPHGLVL